MSIPTPEFSYKQFVIYVVGGGLTAAIDLSITWIMLEMGIWYVGAVSVGFIFSLLFNYLFHSIVTFTVSISRNSLVKFLIVVAVNYMIMLSIVVFFTSAIGQSVLLGKVVSLPIMAVQGYLLGKHWAFKYAENPNP
ncbi:GtrA family protein [Thiolapillus brandeum]|uniref:GtrA/DPMS transmembrane domain-containing protein n=1 Tax=Thiolapillus brandeum TaxID=1076588 RepID=A0A7U6JHG1_9GAMM|nr:GtrA family protein [Thiolapillus brandeum]BAO44271.1 conserved hypothetical protein [Thiolapillus brandeum]